MSIASADLVWYGSANHQETDVGTPQGGAIDTSVRVVPDSATEMNLGSGSDTVDVRSDNAGDTTQVVTVTGRLATGEIDTETYNLAGVSWQAGVKTFERILKIVVDGAHTGTIEIRENSGSVLIASIETGVLSLRRLFYDSFAEDATGAQKDYYEKIFVKNNHGTLSLLNVIIAESSDPTGDIDFALEDAVDDTGTSTNRLTAPSAGSIGASGFSSSSKDLETETDASTKNLAAGSAVGVWVHATLPAGEPATKSTYGLSIAGASI